MNATQLPDFNGSKFRNGRGFLTEEAMQFLETVIANNDWLEYTHVREKYGISANSFRRIRYNMKNRTESGAEISPAPWMARKDEYYTEEYLLDGVKYSASDLKGEELGMFLTVADIYQLGI